MYRDLSKELVSLFDLKKAKIAQEKKLNREAEEAQRDIRLLIAMFKDGIEDLEMMISEGEWIKWDSHSQRLYYKNNNEATHVDAAPREVKIRIRPYLVELVKKAREFYDS